MAGFGAFGEGNCGRGFDDERDAGADAPSGVFLPMFFFAEVPAVIAGEDDDGVVFMRPVFEGI